MILLSPMGQMRFGQSPMDGSVRRFFFFPVLQAASRGAFITSGPRSDALGQYPHAESLRTHLGLRHRLLLSRRILQVHIIYLSRESSKSSFCPPNVALYHWALSNKASREESREMERMMESLDVLYVCLASDSIATREKTYSHPSYCNGLVI